MRCDPELQVNGDTTVEANETFFVNLSNAVNATISDAQGVGTINNDDTLPPTVSIATPSNGATFTAPAKGLVVRADATDSDGTVVQVEFFDGTTLIGTATSSPFEIIWNNVAAGTHILTAKATDNLGATATSSAVTITGVIAPPVITTQPQSQTASEFGSAMFTVVATGTGPLSYQWKKNGVAVGGATSTTLTLSNVQLSDAADYTVTVSNAGGSVTSSVGTLTVTEVHFVAWGDNTKGQTTVPAGLSDVIAVAGGLSHSLALKSDGTVVAWGDNTYGQCTVPAGLSGVVSVAEGYRHCLALKSDGTVVAWGSNTYGQSTVPAGLSGVFAIASRGYGGYHSLAVK